MGEKQQLGIMDYVVIFMMLGASMVIGIKFQFFGKQQKSAREYMLAGKNMWKLPVVFSITATLLSSTTMIGFPSEIYRFGVQKILSSVSTTVLGVIFSAYFITPIFFNCKLSSAYEYLEMRYGKSTRRFISALFIIQVTLVMSALLYAPVLALSAVTNLSLKASILVIGFVCTFYCSIGGLKAVLWTDVLQGTLMFVCLFALYVQGLLETGGFSEIIKRAEEGDRINFFELDVDLTTRYTFWNVLLRGFVGALAFHGTSQVEVQRLLSLSSMERARSSLLWSTIPMSGLLLMCNGLGLVIYAIYYSCDPILNRAETGLTKYDQIIPYYIVTRFSAIPGLTGLCIAGIFSGSLSSLSSMLNSLSTVTVVDFIKPAFSATGNTWLTEMRTVYIAKAMSVMYGIMCIGLTFCLSKSDSIIAVTNTLYSVMEGPMLGIYLIGMLTRKGDQKCAIFGVIMGLLLSSIVGYGTLLSGYRYPSLPLSTSGCSSSLNVSSILFENTTASCLEMMNCNASLHTTPVSPTAPPSRSEPFIMFRVSFMWLSTIGLVTTVFFIFLAVLLTGWNKNVVPANSKCLSPLTRLWMKHEDPSRTKAMNGLYGKEFNETVHKEEEMVALKTQIPDLCSAKA